MIQLPLDIQLRETAGVNRSKQPLTFGLPLPKGLLQPHEQVSISAQEGGQLPLQAEILANWPDQSVRWLLLDTQVSIRANHSLALRIHKTKTDGETLDFGIQIAEVEDGWHVNTGVAIFHIDASNFGPFKKVLVDGHDRLAASDFTVVDAKAKAWQAIIDENVWETKGRLRVTLKQTGWLIPRHLRFFARLHFYARKTVAKLEITLHNPQRAKHKGGLWDLGDAGSVYFKDAALSFTLRNEGGTQIQYVPESNVSQQAASDGLEIYQDSSGGENWRCHNHINRHGEIPLAFRGYRVSQLEKQIATGRRAQPILSISDANNSGMAITLKDFWQNFPKALEVGGRSIIIRLFPRQFQDVFELQGGEQKTHTVFCDFGSSDDSFPRLNGMQQALAVQIPPEWYAYCGLIEGLPDTLDEERRALYDLVQSAVTGDNTFFKRRDIIDEYGWRNFGELYADHEAAFHEGEKPLVSHYNNQYDGICGSLKQFMLTGNSEWYRLADELARHVIDIDIYHTDDDRPEYNHGLFWHTNHYLDVGRCTHRGFSADHLGKVNSGYGGGPSLSHVYSSGLLLHFYVTGHRASLDAFQELAAFVINNISVQQRFSRQLKDAVKAAKNKLGSLVNDPKLVDYNKVYELNGPGRASGNALCVLLDAYEQGRDRRYLDLAEQLIQTCIHPQDDFVARDLLDVENRWMYTIFLQTLCRYLDLKDEWNERDERFHYAKASLLHYAKWMVENESCYLDKPNKLQYPNETWAVQDLRKVNIFLYIVHKFGDMSLTFENAGISFLRSNLDYLFSYETKNRVRPLILLLERLPHLLKTEIVSEKEESF